MAKTIMAYKGFRFIKINDWYCAFGNYFRKLKTVHAFIDDNLSDEAEVPMNAIELLNEIYEHLDSGVSPKQDEIISKIQTVLKINSVDRATCSLTPSIIL